MGVLPQVVRVGEIMVRIPSSGEGQRSADGPYEPPFWAFNPMALASPGRQLPHQELMPMVLWAESRQCLSAVGHLARVRAMVHRLALLCGETMASARSICDAATFHDIGHVWLQAEGQSRWFEPDASVRDRMREHVCMGERFLQNFPGTTMALASTIARFHHECWNGTGYPDGLRGDSIPLGARMVAVVHFFEENTRPDPLGERMCHPVQEVFEMISTAGGYYFDPRVARIFCAHANDFLELGGWRAVGAPSDGKLAGDNVCFRGDTNTDETSVNGVQGMQSSATLTLGDVLDVPDLPYTVRLA